VSRYAAESGIEAINAARAVGSSRALATITAVRIQVVSSKYLGGSRSSIPSVTLKPRSPWSRRNREGSLATLGGFAIRLSLSTSIVKRLSGVRRSPLELNPFAESGESSSPCGCE
jgi:hypothetical protein